MHRPQRLLADAATGQVDDTFERKIIGGLMQDAAIGDGVADFGAFVKTQAADDAIGQSEGDQPLLKGCLLYTSDAADE